MLGKLKRYVTNVSTFLITAALIAGRQVVIIILLLPKTWKYGIGMIWMT